ncbi:piggyBac transposable element-derived protein 3 [Periophthalmus magnuspinnatus]|uniref:piggyBac transposable element-derived protein 3 n=1 Tax=Periophthalmus magnuspinnatus TaxID=409849 RepID=UPI0024366B77|nr:piggyBac transposable element-derived protein 3 [Periophthalmus magnuspinnatus]
MAISQKGVEMPRLSRGPTLNTEDFPDTVHIKEEPEEECIKQEEEEVNIKHEDDEESVKKEEEQLQVCVPESSSVCVKKEETSLLQQREDTQGEDISSETEGDTEHSSDNDEEWRAPFSCSAAQMETEANGDRNNQVQFRARSTTSPNSERLSLSRQEMELLWSFDGNNSEVEDLSDIDDAVGNPEYQPSRQEQSSSEEDSECEDSSPQTSKPDRGHKRKCDEYEGYRSDRNFARRRSRTEQDEGDDSNNVPEETTPGPNHHHHHQSHKGSGMRWKACRLTPNQAQFEHEDENVQDREEWSPLDYIKHYIDKDLMKTIAHCSNATSLAKSGVPLNTSTDEIYHYFGACILMSCVPYPEIRMYWSKVLRFPAITEKFTRDRFFRLRSSLKVLIDDDVPEDLKTCDQFWKVRPFLNRILQGCKSQARPECVCIDEQMIAFTGACPYRQYLPMKPNPVGMKNFVCATTDGLVLDFEIYQGVDALREQLQEPEDLGLGGLVLDRLSQTLHPHTRVYCDRFFTSIRSVEHMKNKQIYVTGTVMKSKVTAAVEKLPTDKTMKKDGRGTSAQVTTEDGTICVLKWYDNKPVLMISAVHDREPEDTYQRWDKKLKRLVTISRPSIVREYRSKMGGVDLVDRIMSYYRMSGHTKKWTLRMMMHFTDLALANSWLLYCKDRTACGKPKKNIMQFLEFRMEVAMSFLAQHDNENSDFSECENDPDILVQGKRRPVLAVPHVSVRRKANAHLPEVVNLKNAVRCRAKGCSGKTRVQCVTCKMFLCLQADRNCYIAFHT